jgi:hypothetical protein
MGLGRLVDIHSCMRTPFQKYLVDSLHEQVASAAVVSTPTSDGGRDLQHNPELNQDELMASKPPDGCVSCNGVWLISINGTRYYMETRKPFRTLHFWYNGEWHDTQP